MRVVSTFNFGYTRLTLKEGPKVKSDNRIRLLAHVLQVGFTLQSSRTNNKRVISTFNFGLSSFDLKGGAPR